jgi:hypothetical protein
VVSDETVVSDAVVSSDDVVVSNDVVVDDKVVKLFLDFIFIDSKDLLTILSFDLILFLIATFIFLGDSVVVVNVVDVEVDDAVSNGVVVISSVVVSDETVVSDAVVSSDDVVVSNDVVVDDKVVKLFLDFIFIDSKDLLTILSFDLILFLIAAFIFFGDSVVVVNVVDVKINVAVVVIVVVVVVKLFLIFITISNKESFFILNISFIFT